MKAGDCILIPITRPRAIRWRTSCGNLPSFVYLRAEFLRMYYIVFGLLYVISLLPFPVLYLLSDVLYFVLYFVAGYRRKVVMNNLLLAFPEKTNEERKAIARKFYRRFTDN